MEKQAFLFGANQYERLTNLKYAHLDAEGVASELKNKYQFHENEVFLACGSNVPRTKIDFLNRLERSTPLDLLFVGFWGRSVWYNGECYLCLTGTRLEKIKSTALSLKEFRDAIRKIPAKNVCLILDCSLCRPLAQSGGFQQFLSFFKRRQPNALTNDAPTLGTGAQNTILKLFAPQISEQSNRPSTQTIAILNSCSDGERAYEWDEKSLSIFSHYLIEALKWAEPSVTRIFSYVREQTQMSAAAQTKLQTPFHAIFGGTDILLADQLVTLSPPTTPTDSTTPTD
ncbi:MAG: caspase family protein, partial [Planctomycetia bacterium]|nr:caspase family protein [Planctomycetia bacterium]